jgi:hypothetical protein
MAMIGLLETVSGLSWLSSRSGRISFQPHSDVRILTSLAVLAMIQKESDTGCISLNITEHWSPGGCLGLGAGESVGGCEGAVAFLAQRNRHRKPLKTRLYAGGEVMWRKRLFSLARPAEAPQVPYSKCLGCSLGRVF